MNFWSTFFSVLLGGTAEQTPVVTPMVTELPKTATWSPTTLYEYGVDRQPAWYANFDYEDGLVSEPRERYLGRNKEHADKRSQTNREYGEYALKPGSVGWNNWIDDQINRAVGGRTGYIEFDNADYALQRNRAAVRKAYELADLAGLKVLLKNPEPRDINEFAHYAVGAIFEEDSLSPAAFAAARKKYAAPKLQAIWVRFGNRMKAEANGLAKQIRNIPGTAVQLGKTEYHGMKLIAHTP